MNKLIGLCGKISSGKTTLANKIKDKLDCIFIEVDKFRRDALNNEEYVRKLKKVIIELNNYDAITTEILNKYIYTNDYYMSYYKKVLYKYLFSYINTFDNKTILVEWSLIIKDNLINEFDKVFYLDVSDEIRYKRVDNENLEEVKKRDKLIDEKIPDKVTILKGSEEVDEIINMINDVGCKFSISKNKKAIFEITHKCNYHCSYCIFKCNGMNIENELSYHDCIHIIDELVKNGFKELKITGGEPFIRKDIIDILKYASHYLKTDISTNASLITDDIVDKLNQINLKMIHVSLDGEKLDHEKLRGINTYEKTIDGLKCLKKSINKVRIGTVISSLNEDKLKNIIEDAIVLSADEIIFSIMEVPKGVNIEHYKNKSIELLQNEINDLKEYYKNDIIVNANFLLDSNQTSKCPAGTSFIYINNYGQISPCTWVNERFGLISQKSLKDHTIDELYEEDELKKFLEYKDKGICYAKVL